MRKWVFFGIRLLGVVLVAHALMLLGADEISTIEAGGIRTIRSLARILTLYRADSQAVQTALPPPLSSALAFILSLPGWGVLAVTGGVLVLIARARE